MSVAYGKYLDQHLRNVFNGYDWIRSNLPDILNGADYEDQIRLGHDGSKFGTAEYPAYDAYFYGKEKTDEIKENFNYAWLHHIHHNPHHWQYWVLINDEPGEGMVVLDMPHSYIIELICDWWAFSWAKGNLFEIFSWYDKHKAYMKLSDKTRTTVEDILSKIREKLEEETED